MNFWWILTIVCFVLAVIFVAVFFIKKDASDIIMNAGAILLFVSIVCLISCIPLTIAKKREAVRQLQERKQIEYQIEHLTDDKDKIKLNEWILEYNDWVNDVNTSKKVYGIFSFYYNFDMSEHTIIDLV